MSVPCSEKIAADVSFRELGADSLDTVELVMKLEEEFDINISDEDAEKIATVGDAIRYIVERMGDDGPPTEPGG